MGFRDGVRRAREASADQPEGLSRRERRERAKEKLAAEDRAAFEEWLAPDAERPYVEILDAVGQSTEPKRGDLTGWKPTVIEAYLGIVGVRPEDCLAVWPGRIGTEGDVHSLVVAYRDRPDYEAGRERFADWQSQNA